MDSKVSILFTLGEASRSRKWPDYLEHGFTEDDVPELVQLVLDKGLHEAEGKSKEVWVPLHAWRTIGQIGSAEAVEPLLSMFDYLEDDDWALEELPFVMGMIGEQAFEALSGYLADSSHGEYARAMAGHGIKEVAVHNPQSRDKAVKLLTDYLEQPDPINISLNAIVVNYLIDLKAVESIETIRSIYAKGLADLASAGDIEDVEIELGIREGRSTPKPNYLAQSALSGLPKPVDDDVDELIEFYFEKYGSDDSILNTSELDGFFASITCSPELIKPSKWTHAIWGGSNQTPEWETIDEAQSFLSAVMPVYNDVVTHMRIGVYEPLYMEANMGGKIYPIVEDWCAGFMKGLDLWPRLSQQDKEVLLEKTETIRFFVEEEDFKGMSLNDIFERQDEVENEVVDLYTYFNPAQKTSVVTTFQHEAPKVGRNDPCPCGSGKKYKKCCLH